MRIVGGKLLVAAFALALLAAYSPARAQTSTPAIQAPVQPGVQPGVSPPVRSGIEPGVSAPGTPLEPLQPSVEPERGETVRSRARPEYDPVGIRWREPGFFIYPSMTYSQLYDTNIFADEDDEIDDFIAIISPQLQLLSDWNNHALNFNFRGDFARYFSHSDENFEDLLGEATGRVDITRDTNVFGGFRASRRHEDRGSPDDVRGEEPTIFHTLEPQVGAFHRMGRFTARLDGNLRDLDFEDAPTPTGDINNDDRDRQEWLGAATGSYEVIPGYDAFVQFAANRRRYEVEIDDTGFDRDSKGWEVNAGTALDLTGLIFGNVFAGYRRQDYEDGRLDTVSGPSFGGDLTWTPTGLTTVNGFVSRTIEESTLSGASGFFATRFGASVDHELLRNLLLNASGSLQMNEYEGISRDDDIYRAGASARYFLNRNIYLSGGYEYSHRDSNVSGQSFTIHVFLLRLEGQL